MVTDAAGATSAKTFDLTVIIVVITGNLTSTLKNVGGGNSQASFTHQWLYTTPLQTADGANPATFNNVPAGSYLLEGYHDETFWGKEFWTSNNQVVVSAGQTTPVTLTRNYPYAAWVIKDNATGTVLAQGQSVPVGTTLRAEVTVRNDVSGSSKNSTVEFLFDRSRSASFDYDQTSAVQTISGSGGTRLYTFTYTPATGTYYHAFAVRTTIGGNSVLTDSLDWVQAVTVTSVVSTGSISSTLKNVGGSNSQASFTHQWLYTTPLQTSDGVNPATFNNVPVGNYLLEGYHDETFWGKEFWTSNNQVVVNAGQTTPVTLTRNYPYAAWVIKDNATGTVLAQGQSVPVGTTLRAEVTVHNDVSGTNMNSTVEFLFDRSRSASFDYDQTSAVQTISGSGGTRLYTFTYTPAATGTYYQALAVRTTIGGNSVLTDSLDWVQAVTVTSVAGCGDERDQMIAEYAAYGVSLSPTCSSFTQTAHSVYFTFAELNVYNTYPWAIIRPPLTVAASAGYGLDRWRQSYGSARNTNSVYRAPAHNAAVGGSSNSRHMFGDAVDLRNQSGSQTEWNAMVTAAGSTGAKADYIEPQSISGLAHVHADWRNH